MMAGLVNEILDTFDRLTDAERLDVIAEPLKRTSDLDFPPLSDDDLVLNAEDVFLALDEQKTDFCPGRYPYEN